jgi:hypothetical protein
MEEYSREVSVRSRKRAGLRQVLYVLHHSPLPAGISTSSEEVKTDTMIPDYETKPNNA